MSRSLSTEIHVLGMAKKKKIMTKNNNIDKYTEVGHMPLALSGLKGATLGNVFHVVGGYFDHQYYDEVIL